MSENRKLNMEELGRMNPVEFKSSEKTPLVFFLDNVRSMNNVGSVFRSADAFRLEEIRLTGITPQPPHREIQKTALGATETVQWVYSEDALVALQGFKAQGYTIICAEQVANSKLLSEAVFIREKKYVVVLGNEVDGVRQELIDIADYCVEIPQAGTKHSLNIAVAAGIVAWEVYRQTTKT
ncbi:MAG TPA: RNA methyltransferase [Bacteroidia bacterium]|nr:RNA methyltransferase [Bacteroidia bacterium]